MTSPLYRDPPWRADADDQDSAFRIGVVGPWPRGLASRLWRVQAPGLAEAETTNSPHADKMDGGDGRETCVRALSLIRQSDN